VGFGFGFTVGFGVGYDVLSLGNTPWSMSRYLWISYKARRFLRVSS
jgi:hypothetical protein